MVTLACVFVVQKATLFCWNFLIFNVLVSKTTLCGVVEGMLYFWGGHGVSVWGKRREREGGREGGGSRLWPAGLVPSVEGQGAR